MSEYQHIELEASALRVYVMHGLHETEELLTNYKFRLSIVASKEEKSDWECVISATNRVITYIKNYQHNGSLNWRGLSAVEAAKDALTAALNQAQLSSRASKHQYFTSLSKEHTLRSKCLVNSIVSTTRGDHELACLWEQAAQYVLYHSQLRCTDSKGKSWPSVEHFKQMLQPKSGMDRYLRIEQPNRLEEEQKLTALAQRNHRLSAVHSILGHKTDYLFAAKTYEAARDIAKRSTAVELWETAVSSMCQAAEMIEAQAMDNTAHQDPLIQLKIEKAERMAVDAGRVRDCLRDLNDMEHKHTHYLALCTTCKNVKAVTAYELVTAAHKKSMDLYDKYVDYVLVGESQSAAAVALLSQYRATQRDLVTVAETVDNMELNIKRAAFFETTAAEGNHFTHSRLRELWRLCWTEAARYTGLVVELNVSIIQNVFETVSEAVRPSTDALMPFMLAHRLRSRLYVYCANELIGAAVKYFNCARGAGTTQSDPRLAQWWSAAAKYQLEAVEKYLGVIDRIRGELRSETAIPALPASVDKLVQLANRFASAADYLQRAHMLRSQADALPHAVRVAELYTQAAELLRAEHSGEVQDRAVKCCLGLIDELTLDNVCAERMRYLEKCCVYSCHSTDPDPVQASKWLRAFEFGVSALTLFDEGDVEEARVVETCAVLYANCALAHAEKNPRDAAVYNLAANAIEEVMDSDRQFNWQIAGYCITLARELCARFTTSRSAPPEFELLGDAAADLSIQLIDHIHGCDEVIECDFNVFREVGTLREMDAWYDAQTASRRWNQTHFSMARNALSPRRLESVRADLSKQLDWQYVVLVTHMSAAHDSTAVYDDAVAMCHELEDCWCHAEAAEAIRCHAAVSDAIIAKDDEMVVLQREAAAVASELVRYLMSTAVGRTEVLEYKLQAAQHRILALQARRKRLIELSSVHDQIAVVSTELMNKFASPVFTKNIRAIQVQGQERGVLLERIGRLKTKAEKLSRKQVQVASASVFVPVFAPEVVGAAHQGIVSGWMVQIGDMVEAYEVLTVIEIGQGTVAVHAPCAGIVARVYAEEGARVEAGEPVMCIQPF